MLVAALSRSAGLCRDSSWTSAFVQFGWTSILTDRNACLMESLRDAQPAVAAGEHEQNGERFELPQDHAIDDEPLKLDSFREQLIPAK